jgi:dephospho-CoA kinase
MLIGITGQIGSGKTEVAKIFKKKGAHVISADKIGKDVVEKDQSVLEMLVSVFGENILTPSGKLRRRKLGEMALASEKNKRKLNRIVHPYLLKELSHQAKSASKKNKIVIIDAALLIDWGWDKKVDITILVHAGDKIKVARLVEKGYSKKEARMRLKSQLKYRILRSRADIIIFNNKSLDDLKKRIEKIFNKLT